MTPRCEIPQTSFRQHLLRQFDLDDACLRFFLRRQTLYLFYPTILMLGDIAQKTHDAFLDAYLKPLAAPRNLLSEPPGELVSAVAGELLCRMDYIEYAGKNDAETDDEGEVTREAAHEYRVRLSIINQMFRAARLAFDCARARKLLKGEEGMSERLLIEKYEAMHVLKLSHKRARDVLQAFDAAGLTAYNGHKRVWGRDVLSK